MSKTIALRVLEMDTREAAMVVVVSVAGAVAEMDTREAAMVVAVAAAGSRAVVGAAAVAAAGDFVRHASSVSSYAGLTPRILFGGPRRRCPGQARA